MVWNAFGIALREIRRNLMRSALTILGIVIGVAAVIVMVSIGRGATIQVSDQIARLGTNLLMVRPGQYFGFGQRVEAPKFELADAEAIARDVASVAAVAPSSSGRAVAIAGNRSWVTNVTGTDDRFLFVRDWGIDGGRMFADTELRTGKAVCVIGATVRKELFGRQNPVGAPLRLGTLSCQVIGVLSAKGETPMGTDQDDLVLTPLRTYWRRIAGNQDVDLIQVSARDGVPTEKVKRDLELLLRERRRVAPSEDDDFSVRDMKEIAQALTQTTEILTALLGAVAAVSLLVGGIGIMNIMLVSVTERTREIGIRLAIGALGREVMIQFLVEAAVLSSFGGAVGLLVALVASAGLASVLRVPFVFDPTMAVLAVLFSASVGVVFGFVPARAAARLDPIEALRHE
jgi:putative ABC transport system permease protein